MTEDFSLDAIASKALCRLIEIGESPEIPLTSDQQIVAFDRLAKELKRLKSIEKEQERLTKEIARVPAADRFVYFGPEGRLPLTCHDDDWYTRLGTEQSNVDDEEKMPYDRAQDFQSLWSYISDDELAAVQLLPEMQVDTIHWDSYEVYTEKATSDLVVRSDPSLFERESYIPLYSLISSTLMLYRLIVTFWPMRSVNGSDGYKGCWELTLILRQSTEQGFPSLLTFSERGGSIVVHYDGSRNGSDEALKLLKYLVSKECAHPYDAVLAGRQA